MAYLKDVFERLPTLLNKDLATLLPAPESFTALPSVTPYVFPERIPLNGVNAARLRAPLTNCWWACRNLLR
jgi:hypothetical protein